MIPLGLVPTLRRGLQQPGQEPATAPADLSGTIGEPPPDQTAQALAALAAMAQMPAEGDSLPPVDPAIAAALPEGFAEAAASIEPTGLEEVPDPGMGRRLAAIFLASLGGALSGQPGLGSQLIQQQRQRIEDVRTRNRARVQEAVQRRLDFVKTGLTQAEASRRDLTRQEMQNYRTELNEIADQLNAETRRLEAERKALEGQQRYGPGGIEERRTGAAEETAAARTTTAGAAQTRAETERDITAPALAEQRGATAELRGAQAEAVPSEAASKQELRAAQAEQAGATADLRRAQAEAVPEKLAIARDKLGVDKFRSETDRFRAETYAAEVARKTWEGKEGLRIREADLQYRIERSEAQQAIARRELDLRQQKFDAETDAKLDSVRDQFGQGLERWYMTLAAQLDSGDKTPVIALPNGAKYEGAEEILKLLDQAAELKGRDLEFNDRRAVEALKRYGRDVLEPILQEFDDAAEQRRTTSRLDSIRAVLPGGGTRKR